MACSSKDRTRNGRVRARLACKGNQASSRVGWIWPGLVSNTLSTSCDHESKTETAKGQQGMHRIFRNPDGWSVICLIVS